MTVSLLSLSLSISNILLLSSELSFFIEIWRWGCRWHTFFPFLSSTFLHQMILLFSSLRQIRTHHPLTLLFLFSAKWKKRPKGLASKGFTTCLSFLGRVSFSTWKNKKDGRHFAYMYSFPLKIPQKCFRLGSYLFCFKSVSCYLCRRHECETIVGLQHAILFPQWMQTKEPKRGNYIFFYFV